MREGQVKRDRRTERGFACVGIWLWTRREGELGRVRLSACGNTESCEVTRRNSRNDLQDILRYAKHCDIPIGPIERPLCPELYQMLIHVWVAPML